MRKSSEYKTITNKPLVNTNDLSSYFELKRKEIASPYIRLKIIQAELSNIFHNQVEIVKSSFANEKQDSFFRHLVCGNRFSMPLEQLKNTAPDSFCPHCHGFSHLRQLGDIHSIQDYVWNRSSFAAGFCDENNIGGLEDYYDFRCAIHGIPYPASFKQFLKNAPGTNACPLCEIDHKEKLLTSK